MTKYELFWKIYAKEIGMDIEDVVRIVDCCWNDGEMVSYRFDDTGELETNLMFRARKAEPAGVLFHLWESDGKRSSCSGCGQQKGFEKSDACPGRPG